MNKQLQTAVFAGGCFWCTEAVFLKLRGVKSVVPGYTGGQTQNPTYEQVSSGTTGHAEVIKFEFDPEQISYRDLLEVFFATHDPTTLNQQGNDIGTQYRSVIFYANESQKQQAEKIVSELTEQKAFANPIVTAIEPLGQFYEAEDYHKNYYERNSGAPYCQVVIAPKLAKFKQKFASLIAE
ncbi:MAG TPA: peptide-methionine (S)-S-oxide reductase MsrA [Candidatus Doudnabacteria bacterium]|nr:peptide-methionine (S)-S-oxide reductase MsrA [Candidatus Doudnabacteria bacterium]